MKERVGKVGRFGGFLVGGFLVRRLEDYWLERLDHHCNQQLSNQKPSNLLTRNPLN
jgi:hypothetical protein